MTTNKQDNNSNNITAADWCGFIAVSMYLAEQVLGELDEPNSTVTEPERQGTVKDAAETMPADMAAWFEEPRYGECNSDDGEV